MDIDARKKGKKRGRGWNEGGHSTITLKREEVNTSLTVTLTERKEPAVRKNVSERVQKP